MNDAPARFQMRLGVRVPMRDGVELSAILYLPSERAGPIAAIMALTPYVAQSHHGEARAYAERGYAFLTVDSRGRGESGGAYVPYVQDADDGHDAVEWLAAQPFCSGDVAMWGGSYLGFTQWLAAKTRPPHLRCIAPTASPFVGVDFPMRNNISYPYILRWITFVTGRMAQRAIFDDVAFWDTLFRERFATGVAFDTLGEELGRRPPVLDDWADHPTLDGYWNAINPTAEQYAAMDLPVLTITGAYDSDQPGALEHYRRHLAARPEAALRHFLVIGPWDHVGAQRPSIDGTGLDFGAAAKVDIQQLHDEWYRWALGDGPRPALLRDQVSYYVAVADAWRHAPTLQAVTAEHRPFYLGSGGEAGSILSSGGLRTAVPDAETSDSLVHDPTDLGGVPIELLRSSLTDQRAAWANTGRQLVYHTAPFERAVEIAGMFRLECWISIDQPDADFHVAVFEVQASGDVVLLTDDIMRARHRNGPDRDEIVQTDLPLRYEFNRFTFVARLIEAGGRLRLVISPLNSPHFQKNYNSARPVARQTREDARTATIRLHHGPRRPSALFAPIGAAEGGSPPSP